MKAKLAVLLAGVGLLFLVFKAGVSLDAMTVDRELSVYHPLAAAK